MVITQIGATLRSYEVHGRAVIWGFNQDEFCSGGRGQVLAPWPGRIRGGTYEFSGIQGVAGLNDADQCCAIHGLVRWASWDIKELSTESVRLEHWLAPQPGYPFSLRLAITYTLNSDGLLVEYEALNEGRRKAPFGIGFHPYLAIGSGGVDNSVVQLPAEMRIMLDARGIPNGIESVTGTRYDFRMRLDELGRSRKLGAAALSDCFTGLRRGQDGRWRVIFQPSYDSNARVTVWGDASFKYILLFTGDTMPEEIRRAGVAIEPMTCPPNALQTGRDLIILDPGEKRTGAWGIVPSW